MNSHFQKSMICSLKLIKNVERISNESCDTKDGYNDAENSTLYYIWQYIHIKKVILNNSISQYFCFYCIFDQIKAALVNKRLFQKHSNLFFSTSEFVFIYFTVNLGCSVTHLNLRDFSRCSHTYWLALIPK